MMILWRFLILLAIEAVAIEGAGTEGFISIDCGTASGTRYQDSTGIWYFSDDSYIETGENHNISPNYKSPSNQSSTLRSFPNETRNCYTLNVTKDSKYLLRATFLYGNYDGKQNEQVSLPLQFDLYLGTTLWIRVNITNASKEYAYEVITVAVINFIWLCLVNIKEGTPFISALELRPLKHNLYPDAYSWYSNAILYRLNYGPTKDVIFRYPDDPYDRIWSWYEYNTTILTSINTKTNIKDYDGSQYEAPKSVLRTALSPISSSNITIFLDDNPFNDADFTCIVVFYFLDFRNLSANQSRQFNISIDDDLWYSDVQLTYLQATYRVVDPSQPYSHVSLYTLSEYNSTLPPILNAIELYWRMEMEQLTSADDVNALLAIKTEYRIVRNWSGDPCLASNLSWHGVICGENDYSSQVISLNLSYFGLSGNISGSFAQLKNIINLDLSHNNLSGDIPESLTTLSALRVLDLSGNHLNGHVPDTLIKMNNSGSLQLSVDSCTNCDGKSKKSSSTVIIGIIVAAIAIVISIMALLSLPILYRRMRIRRGSIQQSLETQVHSEIKKFTLQDLKDITNNFSRTIGRGGFGVVYHGHLEKQIEVAVKVCSPESVQGSKQFLAEVRSLSLVHHKNLVTLVGYCKNGDDLAVVYEYMPRGSLFDHLRGKDSISKLLNWSMRLNITLQAAQGLDYLHVGCGIVHRDVKSNNILLGQNFEAKVSDLGLARTFSADTNSSLITVCGTPGYIDPEYQGTLTLTEKSDVYSFGVVLLEIATGEPPIINTIENIHIVKLVKEKIDKGRIEEVIDSRLNGEYDMNSMLNVVELAMRCTREKSSQRPTMADVVIQLKDSLQMEEHHLKEKLQPNDSSAMNTSSSSTSFSIGHSFASTSR